LARLKNLLFNQVSVKEFIFCETSRNNHDDFLGIVGNPSYNCSMGYGVLVGCIAHGNSFCHFYGNIYTVLRHSHSLVQSKIAKELALY